MVLKQILSNENLSNFENLEVEGVRQNSQECQGGDIYFSLSKDRAKSLQRCQEALKNGASVVVSEFDCGVKESIKVEDVRDCFAKASKQFYGNACDKMQMIAISGTNGKTSTSHIVGEILRRNGKRVGIIGTSGVFYNGKTKECPLTTPDADFLHKTFKEMYDDGVECVVMEVSAHAIDQKRINGINFDLGVLTNITQDHLDYFKTMEEYEKTKLSFFNKKHIKKAVVCVDDERARKLLYKTNVPISTYGLEYPSDCFAVNVDCGLAGSKFVANVNDAIVNVRSSLVGDYNVYNTLAALLVCQELGLSEKQLSDGMNCISPVEGRFNVINVDGKYAVIDFAHSPDGMFNVLKAARKMTDKKIFVVFGCGGNRDKGKRPQMGKVAEQLADYVCLTNDNPRLESAQDIVGDIEAGMEKPHFVELNRAKAIRKMLDFAREGDVVIIAGKGAEKYQEIGTKKYPYNDFDEVYKYCRDKKFKSLSQEKEKLL
ncbi:MAG: UDP-N-acetylmuramoyl-L-alanyl-D-glutamate--2,6-diaminopimelate ligase [Clostridia bacterium]|nr:UDP-N-acetylmuramoyl-L-alanyl-D-glutamate--2,6-diaminopimelate ligase [Clostridia bacterium]